MARSIAASSLVLALGAATTSLPAQSTAASETHFVPAHGVISGGDTSSSVFGSVADGTVAQVSGEVSTSPNYTMEAGISWVYDAPASGPVLAGARPNAGSKYGGELVDVFGYNFLEAGAGGLGVQFGGSPAVGVIIHSNTHAKMVNPSGMDSFTNPVAEVDVRVANLIGAHSVRDAYNYTPSLVEDLHTRVGGTLAIKFQNNPGDLYALAMGKSVGLGLALPPFDGQFQLLLNVQILVNFVPVPEGTHIFSVPVPDDPNLVGGTLEFQAFAAGDLLAGEGTVSNLLPITFLP